MGKYGCEIVRLWAKKFKDYGSEVFNIKTKNGSYSAELKKNIVAELLIVSSIKVPITIIRNFYTCLNNFLVGNSVWSKMSFYLLLL